MTRVAIVHDWLDRPMGGAERVTLELARVYSDAPVYTLLFDGSFEHGDLDPARVRTSRLQRLPNVLRRRPRYLLPLIPGAVEAWDFSGYDLVISSSAAFVKNILTPPHTLHVSYCHSPMRFAWDYWPRYLDEMQVGPVRRAAIRALVHRLRMWDLAGVARVDRFIANSLTTQRRISKYYRADSAVVLPPVAVAEFSAERLRGDHYVTLATLTEYKRIDLAVRAFTASGRPLTVVGDGPDRARLEALAGPTVHFTGHVSDADRAQLLGTARALIFPNEEDFGIAAVESLASGTPVVAYGRGGLTETVEDGRTGVLFAEQSVSALNAAVSRLEAMDIDRQILVSAARRYGPDRFRREVEHVIEAAQDSHARRRSSA